MTYLEQEKRVAMFIKADWKCSKCGGDIRQYNSPQLAHLINQSKRNIGKYGKEIIHSEYNMTPVCSLRCNQAVSLYGRQNSINKLVNNILKGTSDKRIDIISNI